MMEMTYQMFLEGAIAQRERRHGPDDQIVDSHFLDLMADPVAQSARPVRATRRSTGPPATTRASATTWRRSRRASTARTRTRSPTSASTRTRARDVRPLRRALRHHRGVAASGDKSANGDDLGARRLDVALGQEEAPEHQAERAALGVEPVRDAGIAVRDHDAERCRRARASSARGSATRCRCA